MSLLFIAAISLSELISLPSMSCFEVALSFFLSGVLCFVISAIYSHVEKKYKDSEAVSM